MLRSFARAGLLTACFAPVLVAQPMPGMRLFGVTNSHDTHLVDVNGQIVHTWNASHNPGLSLYLHTDGTLYRTIRTSGSIIAGGQGGGVQRWSLDGTLLWDFRYDTGGNRAHHDIEVLPNGNVLMIAWETKTAAEAIAAGRDPAIVNNVFRPDHVIEVQPTGPTSGTIVWEWHVWDHVIQELDPAQANYGVVANHPELIHINYPGFSAPPNGDWNHCNAVEYVEEYDWIILSARRFEEIWIIDHSTTTAEAAGHTGGMWGKGGDLLYRWGNPQAYWAGTSADAILSGQHDPRMIPEGFPGAGNLTIFNNKNGVPGQTEVIEIELPLDSNGNFIFGSNGRYGPDAPIWSVTGTFGSLTQSSAQRLRNGNTLIASANQSLLQEFDVNGVVQWEYNTPGVIFHTHYVERTLWEDATTISISGGGSIGFDMITGSAHAGDWHLLLGSASGTEPGVVLDGIPTPLNVDGWFLMMLSNPNTFPFANTASTLNGDGKSTASFTIPGGVVPPVLAGLQLDHGFLVIDDVTMDVLHASNPVPMTFVN